MPAFLKYLFAIITGCFLFLPGKAQYYMNGSVNASATIQTVMVMSLIENNPGTVNFNSSNQYSNGYTISNFNSISIKSNMPWNLTVSSATSYFSASGTYSSPDMPASVIGFSVSGNPSYVMLNTSQQLLATGNRGNTNKPGNSFDLDFMANPGYNYGPGIYNLNVIYTLTSQ